MPPTPDPKGTRSDRITPRGELEKLRQHQTDRDSAIRAAIMDSMLDVCGDIGYRQVTVETVYRRYGGSRTNFYRHFASKADCFCAAYTRESEHLAQQLMMSPGEGCRDRLQGALEGLAAFIAENPFRAKALFVEVHVAGGDALTKRREVFERLSLALDKAGRETVSRHSSPPITGEFMLNVVDHAVSSALIKGRVNEFSRAVPDLTALICQVYDGGN